MRISCTLLFFNVSFVSFVLRDELFHQLASLAASWLTGGSHRQVVDGQNVARLPVFWECPMTDSLHVVDLSLFYQQYNLFTQALVLGTGYQEGNGKMWL